MADADFGAGSSSPIERREHTRCFCLISRPVLLRLTVQAILFIYKAVIFGMDRLLYPLSTEVLRDLWNVDPRKDLDAP